MPRYFFHLVGEGQVVLDDEGLVLTELSAAHSYGLKLQRQIKQYSPDDACEWTVRIANELGDTLLVILPQRRDMLLSSLFWIRSNS